MLEIGKFPDEWKKAKVHPIFSPMKEISQVNIDRFLFYVTISKIIERVMHTQLLEYYQAGNLLTESQSGFRPIQPLQL